MARVNSSIAAKDYPEHGIKKGDRYWHWTPYRQRKRYSATVPRPSQYETNGTKAAVYAADEDLNDSIQSVGTVEDIQSAIDQAVSDAEQAADEFDEKAQNIEDGFGHETEQSQELQGFAEEVRDWVSELQAIDLDLEGGIEDAVKQCGDVTAPGF